MIVALVVPPLLIGAVDSRSKATNKESMTGEMQQTAAEISNMTGVPVENIVALKQTGLGWNEVLDKLKTSELSSPSDKDNRLHTLTGSGLGDDIVQELIQQGFPKDKILEAKMLVERVQFQLNDIVNASKSLIEAPTVTVKPTTTNNEIDKTESIRKVAGQFNAQTAVTLLLRLEKEFGTLEAVLDEYLFALQADLDLENYLQDKDAYNRSKDEKKIGLMREQIVTTASIEQAMLEQIRRNNAATSQGDVLSGSGIKPQQSDDKERSSALPDAPSAPNITLKDVKPKNPTAEIQNEIKMLNPNK
jgi:hypothetical protein